MISPIVGIIGSIQALEAIKLITETGETLTGRLLVIDGLSMEFNTLKLKKSTLPNVWESSLNSIYISM